MATGPGSRATSRTAAATGAGGTGLRLLVAIGLVGCVVTGWIAADAALTLLRTPAAPLRTSVAAAPDQRWVELVDAQLDCGTQRLRRGFALVLGSDRAGGHPFVAQLEEPDGCAGAGGRPLDGAFVGAFSRDFLRERQGLPLPPGDAVRVFSQSRSPRLLRRALGWRVTWLGLSVLLTLLALRAQRSAADAARAGAEKSGRQRGRG